jgi:hypothetical protein
MWEVWEVMLLKQIQVLQAFEDLVSETGKGAWPAGFAVFGSEALTDDPMMTRVYLSPAATELTKAWPANSFTRGGFVESIPVPYGGLLINERETDPPVRHAIAGMTRVVPTS